MKKKLPQGFITHPNYPYSNVYIKKKEKKVLVFTKTNGFIHNSIPDGVAANKKIGEQQGFIVDT